MYEIDNVIDNVTIDTDAGEYVVTWRRDDETEAPYDEGTGFAFDGGRDRIDVTEGDYAPEVLSILRSREYSSAAIGRYLHLKYGLKGLREVDYDYQTSALSTDRGSRVYGIAWAPDDATNAEQYTDATVAEYRAWAEGDCFSWEVLAPCGMLVGSVGGYYGFSASRDYTLAEARELIACDVADRLNAVRKVGAGFIGII